MMLYVVQLADIIEVATPNDCPSSGSSKISVGDFHWAKSAWFFWIADVWIS